MFIFEEMLPQFTTTQVKNGIDSTDFMIDLSEYAKKKDSASKSELEALVNVVANKLDATPQHKHHIEDVKQLQSQLDSKYDKSEKYSCSVILSDTEKIPYLEAPKVEVLEIAKDKDSEGYKLYVDDSNGDLMIVSPASILIATYSAAAHKWNFGGIDINEHQVVLENHSEALSAVCTATLVNINDINTIRTDVNDCINTNMNNLNSHMSEANSAITNHQEVLENHSEALSAVCTATLVNINEVQENTTKINSVESIINEYIAKTDAVLKNHYDALIILCQKHGMVDSNTGDESNISPK